LPFSLGGRCNQGLFSNFFPSLFLNHFVIFPEFERLSEIGSCELAEALETTKVHDESVWSVVLDPTSRLEEKKKGFFPFVAQVTLS